MWPWAGAALEGKPTYLIRKGKLDRRELFLSSISHCELSAMARRRGYAELADVKTAILETNGSVSMFDRGVTVQG